MALCEAAAAFAMDVLEPGGVFVAKVLAGGAEASLMATLNRAFAKVVHVKPPASRKDSSEKYLVATGFRGRPEAASTVEAPDGALISFLDLAAAADAAEAKERRTRNPAAGGRRLVRGRAGHIGRISISLGPGIGLGQRLTHSTASSMSLTSQNQ